MDVTLRLLRQGKRLSQPGAGKAVGVSGATIARWENGQAEPSTTDGERYASVLGISQEEFNRLIRVAQDERREKESASA